MSRTANKLLAASGSKDAYEIDQSLIFESASSTYLARTPSSAGNLRTGTISFWTKRTVLGNLEMVFSSANGGSASDDYGLVYFHTDNSLAFYSGTTIFQTNRVFRDVGAWYHIYINYDTTQSTASDRYAVYVNGVEQTSFSLSSTPSQNTDFAFNNSNPLNISAVNTSSSYKYNGYIAEFHNIDGTVKPVTQFGEFDSVTGQWIPKKYTGGSYGTTGFYLKFVSGALGTDSSGSSNNWTAYNLANYDVTIDTPTNNFPTLNRVQTYNTTIGVVSEGNLHVQAGTYDGGHYSNLSTTFNVPESGKWYLECRIGISGGSGNVGVFAVTDQNIDWSGVANANLTGADGFFNSLYLNYIKVIDSGSIGGGNTSATAGAYIMAMALDVDNNFAYFGVDNGSAIAWYKPDGSTSGGDPTSGSTGTGGFARTFTTNDTITVSVSIPGAGYGSDGSMNTLNFGQNGSFGNRETAKGNADGNGIGDFWRSPPSGFKALCSKNLPDPAIKKPSEHFDTKLYTGNGATAQEISLEFNPDFVYIKSRTDSEHYSMVDRVRGDVALNSDGTSLEYSVGAFDWNTNNTVDVPVYANDYSMNTNSDNYVMWHWLANGTGGANNTGDINATVSANVTAGFSIVLWEGDGSDGNTVAHGLGKKPQAIFMHNREATSHWYMVTEVIDGSQDYLSLSSNTYAATSSWGAPTSSTISNWTYGAIDVVAYVWAEIAGFSKIGVYQGNGSTNGTFVYTGFKPAWVVMKRTDATSSWEVLDNKREAYAGNKRYLDLDLNVAAAENATNGTALDFLSNGFKHRDANSTGTKNVSGGTYFYMAFAESPFKYSNAG